MARVPRQEQRGRCGGDGRHRQRYGQRRTPRLRRPSARRVGAAPDAPGLPAPRARDRAGPRRLVRHRRPGDRRGDHAAPRFIAGTLTIACAGPIAMELQYLGGRTDRADQHPSRQSGRSPACASCRRPTWTLPSRRRHEHDLIPCDLAEAEAAVAGLPEGELRAALAALGRAVLARRKILDGSSTQAVRHQM